jgi:hypothetical protein
LKAKEAKDRLVLFDRTSAQRTTVIDDQSDYFAIDSNQWLTADERSNLKRQVCIYIVNALRGFASRRCLHMYGASVVWFCI